MKLARPLRRAPLEIARAIAAELSREIADDPAATPFASVDVAPPGFINLRLADAALDGVVGRILAEPASWGRVAAATPRRINVEFVSANPTGPLTIGNARGAFVGDVLCRILEAGGHTVAREYYFNEFGRPDRQARGNGLRPAHRGAGPRRRLSRRLHPGARRRAAGAGPGRRAGARCGSRRGRRSVGGRRGADRDRGQPRSPRRPLRCLEERGLAPHRGLGRPGDRATAGRRLRLRAGRGDLVPFDGVRRRQGSGDPAQQRRADLFRLRHRLCHREVQPRLRGADLHLGRGPPRHRRPSPQRRRSDGLRQGSGPDAADRLGPLHRRRGRGLDEQAGRHVHHPRPAPRRGRRRRGALVLRLARADVGNRLRHRAGQEAVEREPRLLRPVRPRPDRLDPAPGVGGRARAGGVRWSGHRGFGRGPPRPPGRALARGRRGCGGDRGDRRGSRRSRPSWRPRSTPSTAMPRLSTRPSRIARGPGWPSSLAAKQTLANALALLGISAPESM